MIDELTLARLLSSFPHAAVSGFNIHVNALAMAVGLSLHPLARVRKLCLQLHLPESVHKAVLELALEHSPLHLLESELFFKTKMVACS